MPNAVTEQVLSHLTHVTRNGAGWMAHCPAHEDHQKSLAIGEGKDGQVLLKCFAGCTAAQIVAAIGLTMRDLFPQGGEWGGIPPKTAQPRNRTGKPKKNQSQSSETRESSRLQPRATVQPLGLTLEEYADAKQLPIDFLKRIGLSTIYYMGSKAVRIPYLAPDGTELAIRFRLALDGPERFRWRKGSKVMPYGLWRLPAPVQPQPYIMLVEGESDCHTLWYHDIPALGIPGATSWRDAWASALEGFQVVYVVCEPDKGGEAVQTWLASSPIRDRVQLVTLGEPKDPSGLYLRDPAHFTERWQAALDAAIPWRQQATAAMDTHRQEAWEACRTLATHPRILDLVTRDVEQLGVAGETTAVQLLYLILTSRFLPRPISAVVKGPSSAGKSYLAEQVLRLFPASAYYALSSMSERALAYSEEPMQHRFLVVYEAAGLKGDFAQYLVRSLLSEGRISYETIDKTPQGLVLRLIERVGPTGLLITTTAVHIHPENETRVWSIPVTDTPDQTRIVLLAIAEEARGFVDLEPWHALQTWIGCGEKGVTIPYALALAQHIPPVAIRLRRDFGAVLALIRTHALLHQASRDRDASGALIATLEDYTVVRDLVGPLLADAVEATVPAVTRETVEALQSFGQGGEDEEKKGITIVQLAKHLKLDKATTQRRVRVAIDRGYIKNLEEKRGRPARLVLGDPLPDEQIILPVPETLPSGCTVAEGCKGGKTVQSPSTHGKDNGYESGCTVAGQTEGYPPLPPLLRNMRRVQYDG